MSYCVHCGVELADYEKECPLCHTRVLDPYRESNHEPMNLDRLAQNEGRRLNRKFIIWMIFAILMVPFIVTAIISLVSDSVDMSWSFYVLGAELIFFSVCLVPVLFNGLKPWVYVLIDTVAVALFLLLIAFMHNDLSWYLPVALPIALLSGLTVGLIIFIIRHRKLGLYVKLGWLILAISLLPAVIDVCVNRYLTGSFLPVWSWYVTIPLLALGITILSLAGNVRFREWIRRKMLV